MPAAEAPSPSAPLRLFVALLLPEEWEDYLLDVQRKLQQLSPGYMRWVARDTLHLTLVFLGNQPRSTLEVVVGAMEQCARQVQPFPIALDELGTFGSPRRPRVAWVGVREPTGALHRLHARLVAELKSAHVTFDERDLRPHVTVGRAVGQRGPRDGSWSPRASLEAAGVTPRPEAYTATHVSLMRSELRREGPRYTELASALLGGGQAAER